MHMSTHQVVADSTPALRHFTPTNLNRLRESREERKKLNLYGILTIEKDPIGRIWIIRRRRLMKLNEMFIQEIFIYLVYTIRSGDYLIID